MSGGVIGLGSVQPCMRGIGWFWRRRIGRGESSQQLLREPEKDLICQLISCFQRHGTPEPCLCFAYSGREKNMGKQNLEFYKRCQV